MKGVTSAPVITNESEERKNKMFVDNNIRFKLMLFVHIANTVVGVPQIVTEVGFG